MKRKKFKKGSFAICLESDNLEYNGAVFEVKRRSCLKNRLKVKPLKPLIDDYKEYDLYIHINCANQEMLQGTDKKGAKFKLWPIEIYEEENGL